MSKIKLLVATLLHEIYVSIGSCCCFAFLIWTHHQTGFSERMLVLFRRLVSHWINSETFVYFHRRDSSLGCIVFVSIVRFSPVWMYLLAACCLYIKAGLCFLNMNILERFSILYMYECKSIFCFTFSNPLSNRFLNLLIRCNFSLSCKVCCHCVFTWCVCRCVSWLLWMSDHREVCLVLWEIWLLLSWILNQWFCFLYVWRWCWWRW